MIIYKCIYIYRYTSMYIYIYIHTYMYSKLHQRNISRRSVWRLLHSCPSPKKMVTNIDQFCLQELRLATAPLAPRPPGGDEDLMGDLWRIMVIWWDLMRFNGIYPLVICYKLLKMTIQIVDSPIQNGGSFHSYVKLPEGRDSRRLKMKPSNFDGCESELDFLMVWFWDPPKY